MLIPIDRPMIDARNIREAKVYTNPANGFTIEHENKAVVHIIFNTAVNTPTTDATTAITDGSVVGQKLKIIVTTTAAISVALLTIKDSANTKFLGDWVRLYTGESVIPAWLDLIWDGSDWQQNDTNDGLPADVSGANAHGEGFDTTSSGVASHAEGIRATASEQSAHAEGTDTTASGEDSHVEGSNSSVSADKAHAQGEHAVASLRGQHAQAGGKRAAAGDAQFTRLVSRKTTTNANASEMVNPSRLTLDDDKLYACRINIAATKSDLTDTAWFSRMVLVSRGEGVNDVTKVAEYTIQDIGSNGGSPPAGWAVTFTADDANDSLKIEVTGAAATTIYWVAVIECVEVA